MLNLLGLIIAFIMIILSIRKRINFGLSLILGSFEDHQIVTETIELALLMTIIYILAKCMQETGAIKKLIDGLRAFFPRGGILGVIPAVYGLMPATGGALFSAPMIDEEGEKYQLNKNQKNFLNVWFRHIWFTIYPISSAMILICSKSFSDINIYHLVLANTPAFITSVVVGVIYIKKFIKDVPKEQISKPKKEFKGLIYILPPIVPLFFYGILQFFDITQIRSFLIGVIFSIFLLYFLANISFKNYLQIIKKSLSWNLAIAIFGIMIFREMFSVSGVNVIIAGMISNLPFPAVLIIILIPFILGVLTGYNLGAIALSYFLVEPFFIFTNINIVGLTSIIFISSLAGYLISPIHLCNVLSSEYLKTDTTRMYRMYIPSAFFLLLIQTGFVILAFVS